MQSSVHDKSSFTSQFIKAKSRDVQKLLRYLSGIVTFTFKNDADGCAGWSACPEFWSCGNLLAILLLFLFYIEIIFHPKHYQLHQHHRFCLSNNSPNFLIY